MTFLVGECAGLTGGFVESADGLVGLPEDGFIDEETVGGLAGPNNERE